ncbi:MAG TPA: trypsin-like peptidase domain-containing protein [Myxococcota bacterium]|jgi:serine protease Do|nr:trypsin-like peptidase domain-containing protein [Myxococcota bacterium]
MRRARLFALVAAGALCAAPTARADDPFLRRTPTVQAVQRVGPAVVNVTTERVVESPFRAFADDPFFDRFFHDFFEPRAAQTVQSLGSGVLIDAQHHVVTNEHVISQATRVRVSLADGREFDAKLVGADPNNDLAVLRVETEESLPFVEPGTSQDILVGEPAIAIGNPFGLSNTVTTGVISAVDRSLRTEHRVFHGFLQTDASINPGNSGGPLLNAEGRLVGINTAIYGGGAQGIGFAIPIDVAKRVVKQLIERGAVTPIGIGMEVQDLDERMSEVMELPPHLSGVLVAKVDPGGSAERAGVTRGEVVTKVDGHAVQSARDVYEVLDTVTEGSDVSLTLWRGGAVRDVRARAEAVSPQALDALGEKLLGLRAKANQGGGFVVSTVRPRSGAEQVGIQPGDLLLAVNGRELPDVAAFRRAVLDLRGLSQALLVVQRGPRRYHVAVPLG